MSMPTNSITRQASETFLPSAEKDSTVWWTEKDMLLEGQAEAAFPDTILSIDQQERTPVPLGNSVFPHGLPSDDPNAVFKERVTLFEIKGLKLNPARWQETEVDLDSDRSVIKMVGQPSGDQLHLHIIFDGALKPEIRVSTRNPATVRPTGSLCIGFALWGASRPGLGMKLRLTTAGETERTLAESDFVVRAKITTKSIRARDMRPSGARRAGKRPRAAPRGSNQKSRTTSRRRWVGHGRDSDDDDDDEEDARADVVPSLAWSRNTDARPAVWESRFSLRRSIRSARRNPNTATAAAAAAAAKADSDGYQSSPMMVDPSHTTPDEQLVPLSLEDQASRVPSLTPAMIENFMEDFSLILMLDSQTAGLPDGEQSSYK